MKSRHLRYSRTHSQSEVDIKHLAATVDELSVTFFLRNGQISSLILIKVGQLGHVAPVLRSECLIDLSHVDDGQEIIDGQRQEKNANLEWTETAHVRENVIEILDRHI